MEVVERIKRLRHEMLCRYGVQNENKLMVFIGHEEYYALTDYYSYMTYMGMDNENRKFTTICGMKFKRVIDESYLAVGLVEEWEAD